jgi:hypothetical protein
MMQLTLRLNTHFIALNKFKKKNVVVVVDRTIIKWLHPFDILPKKSPLKKKEGST